MKIWNFTRLFFDFMMFFMDFWAPGRPWRRRLPRLRPASVKTCKATVPFPLCRRRAKVHSHLQKPFRKSGKSGFFTIFFSTFQRCKEMQWDVRVFFYLPSLPSNWCSPRQLRWIELLCQGIARRVTNVSTADVHSNVSLDAERPSVGFPWNRAHWATLPKLYERSDSVRNRAALRLRSRNGPRGVRARRATVSRSAARCRRGAVVLGSWAKRWGTAMVVLELEGHLPSCRCFQNCWGFNKQMFFWQMQKFTFLDKQSGSPSKSPWKEKHLLKLDLGVNAFRGRANGSTGKQND